MKTTFRFLLMLIIISTSYSLEPYKIVKVHDSTVFSARVSEDLKTLVVLGNDKVVNYYNTDDWTKTKSIRVYPNSNNYNVTLDGTKTYWIEKRDFSYSSHTDYLISVSNNDTSIKTERQLLLKNWQDQNQSVNVSSILIFDNNKVVLPFESRTGWQQIEFLYECALLDSNYFFPLYEFNGYNFDKRIFVGRYWEASRDNATKTGSSNIKNAIINNKQSILWDISFEQSYTWDNPIAITKDTNLIGLEYNTIFTVNKFEKIRNKTIIPKESYYITTVDDINYLLPLDNEKFLLAIKEYEVLIFHSETGLIIDRFLSQNRILSVSNLNDKKSIVVIDTTGLAIIFDLDFIINKFNSDFAVSNRLFNVPLSVKFFPFYENDTVSYNWNFGDGTTSIEKSPVHRYIKPGKSDVSLEISDGFQTSKTSKTNFIITNGILFENQLSLDTLWVNNYSLDYPHWIVYNQDGNLLTFKTGNIAELFSIDSKTGKVLKSKSINVESDKYDKNYYNNVVVSYSGNEIIVQHDFTICNTNYESDSCNTKSTIFDNRGQYYIWAHNEKIQALPRYPIIYINGMYMISRTDPQESYNQFQNYISGDIYYMKDYGLPDNAYLSLMNRNTGEIIFNSESASYLVNPFTTTTERILLFNAFPADIKYIVKRYLYNYKNDILFFARDKNDTTLNVYVYRNNTKNFEKKASLNFDFSNDILFSEAIENSNYIILLKRKGKLDILDYVKNEIVDHAEIPAEFIGLSINPKGGEFATLSDDGKVIVWKSKNIPLDTTEKFLKESTFVYPNPAGDYINIEFMLENNSVKSATIYSPLGNKLIETENQTTIDISNLYYGVYYVKVGNKYAKFVKM